MRATSRFPFRVPATKPIAVGTVVLCPFRNADGTEELQHGSVLGRRRGRCTNLNDPSVDSGNNSNRMEFEPGVFTRDQAGLYMVQINAGMARSFAHESECEVVVPAGAAS